MRITLVRPNIGRLEHSLHVDEARMEPLELGTLAGLTPDGIDITLADDRVNAIDYDAKTDLAAISVQTFTARRAYEIADEYRSRRVPVVLGGMHVTLAPREAKQHADAIVTGDAEPVWAEVIRDAAAGKLKQAYSSCIGAPHPGRRPRRDIYRDKGYLPLALLQFSRGCPFRCSYCATGAYSRSTHHVRRIDEVLAEIDQIDGRNLFFVDDNIVANPAAAKELFRELAGMHVRWVSQASINMVRDRRLMDLMTGSGCLGNVIGFESLNAGNIDSARKNVNRAGVSTAYSREIAILRDYGLQTWAALTIGYDRDTPESIDRLLEFALTNRFTFAAFNVLMPYPGTPFYETLKRQRRLLYDGAWWLHPEYRFNYAAFRPALMSAEELTEAGFRCRSAFNSPASIFRRAFDLKTNMRSPLRLGVYARYNPLFRRETFKKHGMRLGHHDAH